MGHPAQLENAKMLGCTLSHVITYQSAELLKNIARLSSANACT